MGFACCYYCCYCRHHDLRAEFRIQPRHDVGVVVVSLAIHATLTKFKNSPNAHNCAREWARWTDCRTENETRIVFELALDRDWQRCLNTTNNVLWPELTMFVLPDRRTTKRNIKNYKIERKIYYLERVKCDNQLLCYIKE